MRLKINNLASLRLGVRLDELNRYLLFLPRYLEAKFFHRHDQDQVVINNQAGPPDGQSRLIVGSLMLSGIR